MYTGTETCEGVKCLLVLMLICIVRLVVRHGGYGQSGGNVLPNAGSTPATPTTIILIVLHYRMEATYATVGMVRIISY